MSDEVVLKQAYCFKIDADLRAAAAASGVAKQNRLRQKLYRVITAL
jgi:hypothetical protein